MNVPGFQEMKDAGCKISMVTCYDYSSARAVAESSVDCILVGDSVAMTMHGYPTTLSATTAMMTLHTAAVARGRSIQVHRGGFAVPFLSQGPERRDGFGGGTDARRRSRGQARGSTRARRNRPAHRRLRSARDGTSRSHATVDQPVRGNEGSG